MQYQKLGSTEINVSRICFGSLTISPLQANLNEEEGARLLRYAFEKGINFIDTAKLYRNYNYIRRALKGWHKPVVIASKSYDYTYEGMKKSLDEARLALDRDIIDIFMLHEQESDLTLKGHRPALEYLIKAKSQGIIRAVGVSTHTVKLVDILAESSEIDVIHPIVNIKGLGLLDGNADDMLMALRKAHKNGKGIYGMKALGGGNLVLQAREAIEYVFSIKELHSVALGCRIKEELDFNLAILEKREPEDATKDALVHVKRRLLIEEWCQGCGACVDKCPGKLLRIEDGHAVLASKGCLFCGYCAAVCPQFAIKVV